MKNINQDSYFTHKIVFSDKANFCLNGQVNRHNCRMWSRNNLHKTNEFYIQYPEKVIGGFFTEGILLTGPKYLEPLENV